MKLWKIEFGGAMYTVVANDDTQALGILISNYMKANGSKLPEESPAIRWYEPREEYTFAPWGDGRTLKATAAEWLSLFEFPTYLGCSEF